MFVTGRLDNLVWMCVSHGEVVMLIRIAWGGNLAPVSTLCVLGVGHGQVTEGKDNTAPGLRVVHKED
jgi:hypothetical protein